MEFIKGYMDRGEYRILLSEMTQLIFGFSFEDWYSAGHFEGEYIPYSYIENGEIIANASANIMKMMQNGRKKLYIQIGTVMTRPEFRNRGLARSLIERILGDYRGKVDGFYLYGNLNAVGFYERLGFDCLNQFRYHCSHCSDAVCENQFTKAGKQDLVRYRHALRNTVVNQRLDQINRYSLQLFYTGNMEDVYYHAGLDCFAVLEIEDDVLHVKSVISSQYIPIMDVLNQIDLRHEKVILGFTPEKSDAEYFIAERYDGGEDYRFFYKGEALKEIEEEKLYFPLMSHA